MNSKACKILASFEILLNQGFLCIHPVHAFRDCFCVRCIAICETVTCAFEGEAESPQSGEVPQVFP